MATYAELFDLLSNSALRNKIEMAVAEAARIIQSGEDTGAPFSQTAPFPAQRRTWARRVIGNERAEAERFLHLILMKNKGAATGAILGASDSAVQSNVNDLVDLIAEGET